MVHAKQKTLIFLFSILFLSCAPRSVDLIHKVNTKTTSPDILKNFVKEIDSKKPSTNVHLHFLSKNTFSSTSDSGGYTRPTTNNNMNINHESYKISLSKQQLLYKNIHAFTSLQAGLINNEIYWRTAFGVTTELIASPFKFNLSLGGALYNFETQLSKRRIVYKKDSSENNSLFATYNPDTTSLIHSTVEYIAPSPLIDFTLYYPGPIFVYIGYQFSHLKNTNPITSSIPYNLIVAGLYLKPQKQIILDFSTRFFNYNHTFYSIKFNVPSFSLTLGYDFK